MCELTEVYASHSGSPGIKVAILDGPVSPDICCAKTAPTENAVSCHGSRNEACVHGTAIASILMGHRGTGTLALCPGCTFEYRSIWGGHPDAAQSSTAVARLIAAIIDSVRADARIISISASVRCNSVPLNEQLQSAVSFALSRNVLIVCAHGGLKHQADNALTAHPWTITVSPRLLDGRPLDLSFAGRTTSRFGISAPGSQIPVRTPQSGLADMEGSSPAAAIITGIAALIWSLNPKRSAAEVRRAMISGSQRLGFPPLINARRANEVLRYV